MVYFFNLASRGVAVLGGVFLTLLIGRICGVEALGSFAVFLSIMGGFSILARYGLDRSLVRSIAWAEGRATHGTPVTLLWYGLKCVSVPSLVLGSFAAILLAGGWLGVAFSGAAVVTPLALFLLTTLALIASYAKGRSRAWLAPLFEIGGISMLTAFLLVILILVGSNVVDVSVTIAFVIALFILTFVAGLMIWRDMQGIQLILTLDAAQKTDLNVGRVDFTLIALATFLTQAGSFLLAAPFLSETDLGLLRAAERLALLVSFPVLAINPVIMPRIVRLSRTGDVKALRRLIYFAISLSGVAAFCIAIPLIAWPERALAIIGEEFVEAIFYLQLMVCFQFLGALIGPLAVLLNMSGHERASMWVNITALVLGVVLIPSLSLVYGALGFTIAYSVLVLIRVVLILSVVIYGKLSGRFFSWGNL